MQDRRIDTVDIDEVMAKATVAFLRVLEFGRGVAGVQTVVPDHA